MSTRRPLACPAAIAALSASPAPASTIASTMARDRLEPEDIRVLYRPSPMRRPPAATAANLTARTRATRFDLAVLTAVAGLATLVIIVTSLETPIRAHDLERTAVTLTIEADGRFDLLVENDPS